MGSSAGAHDACGGGCDGCIGGGAHEACCGGGCDGCASAYDGAIGSGAYEGRIGSAVIGDPHAPAAEAIDGGKGSACGAAGDAGSGGGSVGERGLGDDASDAESDGDADGATEGPDRGTDGGGAIDGARGAIGAFDAMRFVAGATLTGGLLGGARSRERSASACAMSGGSPCAVAASS